MVGNVNQRADLGHGAFHDIRGRVRMAGCGAEIEGAGCAPAPGINFSGELSGKRGAPRRAGGRNRERRLQPEIEASLRSQPDGFSVSNSLYPGSRCSAHSRADGCALASARQRANQGSDTSAAADGLRGPLTAASALLGPLAGVDVIALAPGTDF